MGAGGLMVKTAKKSQKPKAWLCGVCQRYRIEGQPHRCTDPDPRAPVLVLMKPPPVPVTSEAA